MDRFTISLDEKLAAEFDLWIAERGYVNRSEAVRDLIRSTLAASIRERSPSGQCIACLSYVFNHHELALAERVTELHHAHHELTVSTMHAHLDHDHCLETVLLRGEAGEVQRFADKVGAERGVHHAKVNLISVVAHQPHAKRAAGAKTKSLAKGGRARARGHDEGDGHTHLHLKPAA